MKSPVPLHKQLINYEEGVIYHYYYKNSIIVIFEGSNAQIVFDNRIPKKITHKKGIEISRGYTNKEYWKEYKKNGVRYGYVNVEKKDRKKFEKILNTIIFIQKKKVD